MGIKVLLLSISNQIQSYLKVIFHDGIHKTKVSCKLKISPNSWKFSQLIWSSPTRSKKKKKNLNPYSHIVFRKNVKTCIVGMSKRRDININLNNAFKRRMLVNMTGHVLLNDGTKSLDHGRMIREYILFTKA
jgi:hypothetical protein